MDIRTRPAEEADWAELLAIESERFGDECYSRFFLRMAPVVLGDHLFVALSGDRIIGYSLAAADVRNQDDAWLLSIAVRANAAGEGVGSRLLGKTLESLKARGLGRVWLSVEPDSPAIRLYQRHGFVAGQLDANFFGVGHSRITMCLELRPS